MLTEYQYLFFAERYTSLAIEVLERLKIGSYAADEAYQSLLDARGTLLSGMREIEARGRRRRPNLAADRLKMVLDNEPWPLVTPRGRVGAGPPSTLPDACAVTARIER